ncbi:MAG: radical SAM family heme chaperone HemW [Verrucomicrobiota bacterium]
MRDGLAGREEGVRLVTVRLQPASTRRQPAAKREERRRFTGKIRLLCIGLRRSNLRRTQHKGMALAMSEMISATATGTAEHSPPGLYMHVPFCASTCDFCAFYQTAPSAEGIRGYLDAMRAEAGLIDWKRSPDTVFWGGGTPGLLSPGALRELGAVVRSLAPGGVDEWSVEMAPASVTEARLLALKEIGVTRISMGVQSFRPELLDALGRQHTREQVFRAYERVQAAGFKSVNLDLMFALPGQAEADWLADIDQAVALGPDHISTYCLTFEEDTKLWVKLSKGQVKLDPEHEARLYTATWARLDEAGYGQYEVSNFARSGHVCAHNVNTWRMGEWIGLGPSAASQHGGWRGANPADLDRWRAEVARGERMTEDRVRLTPGLLLEDAVIFGLRMNEGVDLAELTRRYPGRWAARLMREAGRLSDEGLAVSRGPRLALTDRGRLLADAIGAELLHSLSGEPVDVG